MTFDWRKIKLDSPTVFKLIVGTAIVVKGFYAIIGRLDSIEERGVVNGRKIAIIDSKVESLGAIGKNDKIAIYKELASLGGGVKDNQSELRQGFNRVSSEMATQTNRIFAIYGILPNENKKRRR